jgi:hypothetical protein
MRMQPSAASQHAALFGSSSAVQRQNEGERPSLKAILCRLTCDDALLVPLAGTRTGNLLFRRCLTLDAVPECEVAGRQRA